VGTFTLSTRKSSPVEIDETKFFAPSTAKEWCREKVTYDPDKAKIKAALEAGTQIEGAKIVDRESLQVK
jgi:hypothetical protein